jgi:hypothetical protein
MEEVLAWSTEPSQSDDITLVVVDLHDDAGLLQPADLTRIG